jgi:hypothetical protein
MAEIVGCRTDGKLILSRLREFDIPLSRGAEYNLPLLCVYVLHRLGSPKYRAERVTGGWSFN